MIVTVSGWSGLTNAYRSELSATGSLLISGASRCEDMSHRPWGREGKGVGLGDGRGRQRPLDALIRRAASLASVTVIRRPPVNRSKVPFLASRRNSASGALPPAAAVFS